MSLKEECGLVNHLSLITVATTGVAYRGGRDFLTELKGQTRVIYKSGNAENILNSFEIGGVSTF